MAPSIIANPDSAPMGKLKIAWARNRMYVMHRLLDEYRNKPLSGRTIVTSIHMEAKTACLVEALASLGAEVYATGCNPLSTQDDVAAALAEFPGVTVYARHGQSRDEYQITLKQALSHHPHIIIDDGGDLVELLHSDDCAGFSGRLLGGCEETTTGIHRLKARIAQGELHFPMIDVNDANCKHRFDNHFGTGQSVMFAIANTTNVSIAGSTVVVAGYGDCGSGIAEFARGMKAKVIVVEADGATALVARMNGYDTMSMDDAAPLGDIFITATGCKDIITYRHFKHMKNGAILANAGHFNVEISVKDLTEKSVSHAPVRKNIEGFKLVDGRMLYLLAEGRLVNLAAGDGHPIEIMDMSFSIQLLSVLHIAQHFSENRAPALHPVPAEIDERVAHAALSARGASANTLSQAQIDYLKKGF